MKIVSQYDEAYEIDLEAKTWNLLANPQNVGNLRTTEGTYYDIEPAVPVVGKTLTIIAASISFQGGLRLISIPDLKEVSE